MKLNQETGWVDGVVQKQSPHFDARPDQSDISLLVIHNISLPPGQFGLPYIDQMFMGQLQQEAHPYFKTINSRVSTHFFIDRNGKIVQYVSIYDRAWHAGQSSYQGREKCNDFSIGIELEGTDDQAFTDVQYQALIDLANELLISLPSLAISSIAGHSDIAPGRKTDPGACFDWAYFLQQLKARGR